MSRDALLAQIAAERAAAGWTHEDLSARTGIPVSTLQRYLTGKRDMRGNALIRIALAFGLLPSTLWQRAAERAQGKDVAARHRGGTSE